MVTVSRITASYLDLNASGIILYIYPRFRWIIENCIAPDDYGKPRGINSKLLGAYPGPAAIEYLVIKNDGRRTIS